MAIRRPAMIYMRCSPSAAICRCAYASSSTFCGTATPSPIIGAKPGGKLSRHKTAGEKKSSDTEDFLFRLIQRIRLAECSKLACPYDQRSLQKKHVGSLAAT